MTPAKFAKVGALIYGSSWRRPMAKALKKGYRTILRWKEGDSQIPAGVPDELSTLCRDRARQLMTAARELS